MMDTTLCNAVSHLWVVQVPNINGTSSGRLPQVNRSVGPLRQKQLGQTSNMDVVVIIKVAPPPVIVINERCLLIFSPQHCIPRMKERKKLQFVRLQKSVKLSAHFAGQRHTRVTFRTIGSNEVSVSSSHQIGIQ